MKEVKSAEQLQKLCDDFLESITLRKECAVAVEKRDMMGFDPFIDYIVGYSTKPNLNFYVDSEGRYFDCVRYYHVASNGDRYYWCRGNDGFIVEDRNMEIFFNDYHYKTFFGQGNKERAIMIQLSTYLFNLFK